MFCVLFNVFNNYVPHQTSHNPMLPSPAEGVATDNSNLVPWTPTVPCLPSGNFQAKYFGFKTIPCALCGHLALTWTI